jgi:hypothetical protein
MSTSKKRFKWGGARPGAGRPEGRTKTKICVSVNEGVWQSALSQWNGKASRLVENLLLTYVKSTNGVRAT